LIARDTESATSVAGQLAGVVGVGTLGPETSALCAGLMGTIDDPAFPGALIPNVAGGELSVLVAAPTVAAWRRLSPVLRAFAGPTLTSFEGLPQELPASPAAAAIAEAQPAVTSVMRIPSDPSARIMALRALARARDTMARAPDLQRSAPEPTSWLLARFQDYLNVGRRDAAAEVLVRLKSELRLDALNLKFLEVELLATFGDWTGIVALPGFASLCLARRTQATTALLLEALYQIHLATLFDADDASATRERFERDVRPLARPMLIVPAPPTLTAAGWRLFGLEVWVDPSRADIAAALVGRQAMIGWIADQLESAPIAAAPDPAVDLGSIDAARVALVQADAVESLDTLAAALAAVARLSPEELARLRAAEPFRTALSVAEEAAGVGLPTSWVEWLAMAADPGFTAALDLASRGKDEWPIGASASDPVAVQALLSGLNQALNNELAAERTAQALPFLVAWLQRDPDFPRVGMAPLYASVLTLFALGSARGRVTYESSQVLISAQLSAGLSVDAYRSLIADIEELAAGGFGVDMTYWMLEIVEDFMRTAAPDDSARQTFLHGALARISPIYSRLSGLQRTAVIRLASELGWTLSSLGVDTSVGAADDVVSRMQGLRIAIYSLTETSSRQAKAAIEEAAPNAVVDCNADHGGTPRLRALAENADLFVMTWLSAKHAATDFIREHRGDRPLLYAQGRGFSSILRAIDEHLA